MGRQTPVISGAARRATGIARQAYRARSRRPRGHNFRCWLEGSIMKGGILLLYPSSTIGDDFISHVKEKFLRGPIGDVEAAVRAVFSLISRKIAQGEMEDIRGSLPADLVGLIK